MCGRYVIEDDESVDMAALFEAIRMREPEVRLKTGEIFPTDTVPLIGMQDPSLRPFSGIWGFVPQSGKGLIINARAESVEEKPMFRESFLARRCVIATSGYYEWSKEKAKYRLNLAERHALYLAGLYRPSFDGMRFVILTTEASQSVARIHSRMPLILPTGAFARWLGDTEYARRYLRTAMPELTLHVESV